jgi:hypothetical protein
VANLLTPEKVGAAVREAAVEPREEEEVDIGKQTRRHLDAPGSSYCLRLTL